MYTNGTQHLCMKCNNSWMYLKYEKNLKIPMKLTKRQEKINKKTSPLGFTNSDTKTLKEFKSFEDDTLSLFNCL